MARCVASHGNPQVAFLLFVSVRVGGWWPWFAYRVRERARKKAKEAQKKMDEERRVRTMLLLRELKRRKGTE